MGLKSGWLPASGPTPKIWIIHFMLEARMQAARAEGSELVLVGIVHKSSTLILQLWARLVDARTGRDVFSRDLNFRGDTDEAWRRAEAFLVAQTREAVVTDREGAPGHRR